MADKMIMAVPKGRILKELMPLMKKADIVPQESFFDENSRALRFTTNRKNLDIIRVRSFDVVTFVAFGAAAIGISGSDLLDEVGSKEIYAPLDLGIGKCRLSVAEPKKLAENDDPTSWSHIRIATKYPRTTKQHFAAKGIQAECIKLNGAMELAPTLGLCERIVDLVSTGSTLKANGLVEIEKIMDVSSYFIVNRTAFKTRTDEISEIVNCFKRGKS